MPVSRDKCKCFTFTFGTTDFLSRIGPTVFNAVRAVHPLTPILIFGGHTHIRDCVQLDQRSMALESGRYFETVGWMSANLNAAKGNSDPIKFSRRYLDPNNVTYAVGFSEVYCLAAIKLNNWNSSTLAFPLRLLIRQWRLTLWLAWMQFRENTT